MKRIIEYILDNLDIDKSKNVFKSIGLDDYKIEYNLNSLLILRDRFRMLNGSSKEFYLAELFGMENLKKSKILFDELEKF